MNVAEIWKGVQYINNKATKSAFEKENIIVSYRGSSIRISPNVYNTKDEMNLLAETLSRIV